MPKLVTKTQIKLKIDIKPVKLTEVTPAQRQLYTRFWTKVIAQVQNEVKSSER